jgi:copper chaperone CopZ
LEEDLEKLFVLTSSLIFIGSIGWFFGGKKSKSEETGITENLEEEQTLELDISGMHCAGCAAGIEGTLKNLEGIKSASVNFATSKGIFIFNPAKISKEKIIQKIKELGYDASLNLEDFEKKS